MSIVFQKVSRLRERISFVFRVLNERGPTFFVRYFIESKWFDIRYGTSTSSRVPKEDQNLNGTEQERSNGLLYVASFTSVTKKTTAKVRELIGSDKFHNAQFMDFGCGKGKALLAFALSEGRNQTAPAIGIEYDAELSEMAKANLAKVGLGADRCKVVCDSAANWQKYAERETLIVYLYNSFQGETFDLVMASLQSVPHFLIYVDPAERSKLEELGYSVLCENEGKYHADTWLVAKSNSVTW